MSDAIFNVFTGGMNTMATALTKALGKDGLKFFLLKRAGEKSTFTAIEEFDKGFLANWSEYRQQIKIEFASTEDGLRDKFYAASHFAYGVPDSGGRYEVFIIAEPSRDVIAPTDGFSPFWQIFGTKERHERYLPPVLPDDEDEEEE